MAMSILKIKIMPASPETDLEKIKKEAMKEIEKLKAKLHDTEIEPIAFGLKALILTILWPEDRDLELIENALGKVEDVNSVQVIDFRRAIG
ncbi:MAG: elongation factor 1-beta [Candidatus Pacearchaeota archaeon]|nr:elongation factor 1-beta [Candidatus Pacearchaeota archaeon]